MTPNMYDTLAALEKRADEAEAKNAEALRRARAWLGRKELHGKSCMLDGGCTYCTPISDIIEALEGTFR